MTRRRKGAILVVILGVRSLLALTATTFATLTQVERRISRNFTDDVRAKLIAPSGIEEGVERLSAIVQSSWFKNGNMDATWMYFGSQLDEAQPPDFAAPLGGMKIEKQQLRLTALKDPIPPR